MMNNEGQPVKREHKEIKIEVKEEVKVLAPTNIKRSEYNGR